MRRVNTHYVNAQRVSPLESLLRETKWVKRHNEKRYQRKKLFLFCQLLVANASKEYNQEEISSLQPGALLLVESIRMKGVHYKE